MIGGEMMILFSKDKEIIFKITNAILLIWLLGALVFTANNIIDLLFKKAEYTYNEYELENCSYLKEPSIEVDPDYCKDSYDRYLLDIKNDDYYKKINLYTSIANVVIVGGTMFFINRRKETLKGK